ncbi:MAG: MBL fold metallo-hydrolase [Caulobacteraceae bacterium]|nr:MBL fold metallo-hydrolase [Caulobacteraceae bacterium]
MDQATTTGKPAPEAKAPLLKWRVGDVTVTRIVELDAIIDSKFILPQATPEAVLDIPWLRPHFVDDDGRLKLSVHALVVEAPGRRILVDTCIGNDKPRAFQAWNMMQTRFLEDLETAGFARESIDAVLCTHLHVDHVGWNTMLVDGRWVPTFPKARYLMGRTEFDYWRSAPETGAGEPVVFQDSVQPVFDAGLVDLVETDHVVCDEVSLTPTLGHTPGHVSVRIRSRGEEALITGDFIHHPCQMVHPEWAASADCDPDQSIRTREDAFAGLAGTPTLVIGTHFAAPTAGRVVRDGEAYRLEV